MPLRFRFAGEDLLRCRFAVSPLCETHEAVRTLLRPARHGFHRSWLARADGLELGPLPLVMPVRGYTPDFLGPPPDAPLGRVAEFADEIARLRATDPALAHDEMRASFESTRHEPPKAAASRPAGPAARRAVETARRALLDDPVSAVRALADATERAWEVLVAPDWPRLRDVLEADIAERSRRLAEGGLQSLFADLHPDISWDGDTLALRGGSTALGDQDLAGRGLLLLPSVFAWPDTISGFAPRWQPTLIYPARGMARAWEPAGRPALALARLLGANRAALLTALHAPASTSALAARHGLALSTVSGHLAVLRDAGLLTSRRVVHEVRYARTPLGDALVER
ncbi:DUF5937 family protein [Cryptosporangium sp. NPDC051539]|uniref:ArsR/SmtB family transcription factor n=1 Tax=Cryptosporangium sp. NPDC051539 TaxID=3363962 RepID=UPI0037942239